jgi:cell division protein FtsB
MKKFKKDPVYIVFPIIILALLAIIIVNAVMQNNWGKSVTALTGQVEKFSTQNATIAAYARENANLKEELTAMKQYTEDLKSYADNLSAEVIYVPQYYQQTTVKEIEVAKPVYVNDEWREFESVGKLTEWAKEHLAYLWISGDKIADCDDYAERLQSEAYKEGYLLSLQVIKGGVLNGKNVSNYLELHMGNLAMIDNEIYFIEPQPDFFRVVFVCYRD